MQHFVRFLVDNWYILLEVFLLLLSVVFFILKKPTNKVVHGLYENLYSWCIRAICEAEITGLSGDAKLKEAIRLVLNDISLMYPDLIPENYTNLVTFIIEQILSTPQKKSKRI